MAATLPGIGTAQGMVLQLSKGFFPAAPSSSQGLAAEQFRQQSQSGMQTADQQVIDVNKTRYEFVEHG